MSVKKTLGAGVLALAAAVLGNTASTALAGEKDWSVAREWDEQLLAAIRINAPRPPVHARNLYHTSAAMWDAWAAYDPVPDQIFHHEKVDPLPKDIEAAREETISYAAYRVLKQRFAAPQQGHLVTQANLDAQMIALGYDHTFTSQVGDTPAALGNRIANTILTRNMLDGSNQAANYSPNPPYFPSNPPILVDLPGVGGPLCEDPSKFLSLINPNLWQPLAFEYFVDQGGTPQGAVTPAFVCPHWRGVRTFGLRSSHYGPNAYLDPGAPPQLGLVGDAQYKADAIDLISNSADLDPNDGVLVDISPSAINNNPLGADTGTGHPINPVTGQPYPPQIVLRADYRRVIAEFWADGPASETPPGHWHVVINENVSDYPGFEKRIGGTGPICNDLEWDVKAYITISGAAHDAAVACWGVKGHYNSARPITMIRYMGALGQSSDPQGPSYHPNGLPLVEGLTSVVTKETIGPGGIHEHLPEWIDPPDSKDGQIIVPPCYYDHIGDIALRCWQGQPEDIENEVGGVGWIWSQRWFPYQQSTFVTPPFAGYTSGHSTFSRSTAEAVASITGSPYFPGGMGEHVEAVGGLEFEAGPSTPIPLQWATYYDASDQAAQSRRWGGIHPVMDDYPARIMGSQIGIKAWEKAQDLFNGTTCPADIAGTDDQVGVDDLLTVIGGWGPCAPGMPCFADVAFDGQVNVDDLLEVINGWGNCP